VPSSIIFLSKVKAIIPFGPPLKMIYPRNLKSPRFLISTVFRFDGAADTRINRCGAGGMIKINENMFLKWTFIGRCGSNIKAELLGS
jgi:hypothetical protein